MWFKNLRFYTVDLSELNGVLKDDALVEEALEKASFKPCATQELASVGFAPIFHMKACITSHQVRITFLN